MFDVYADEDTNPSPPAARWKRRARWILLATLALVFLAAVFVKDHVRTLASLHKIDGANGYVMDYYVDYHIDGIRRQGMDVRNIEDACIDALFAVPVAAIAKRVKRSYLPQPVTTLEDTRQHCSTVAIASTNGDVFFGRNLDWHHDAFLILRVHDAAGLASVSVIDLEYLNLNRPDLDETSLLRRLPLLFAPYYVSDGMNRHGVAVSDMSVDPAQPPRDADKPDVIHSTLMRLVLDYARTTEEAIELIRDFNVYFVEANVHLMIADSAGSFVVVEFLDGEIRVTPAAGNWQVCTNHVAWQQPDADRAATCRRYRIASETAVTLDGDADADDMMQIMRSLAAKDWTMWSSVYNLSTGEFQVSYKGLADAEYRDAMGGP